MLFYLFHMVMHFHVHTLIENMTSKEAQLVNSF